MLEKILCEWLGWHSVDTNLAHVHNYEYWSYCKRCGKHIFAG